MPGSESRLLARWLRVAAGAGLVLGLAGCGTTPLPPYEPPLARTEYQTVRTTAYTDTEADHVQYGAHDALGGTLRAAGPPVVAPAAVAVTPGLPPGDEAGGFHPRFDTGAMPVGAPAASAVVGSAAADWSRWPAGTVFRLQATGQMYQVDDYGFALAGRNTIDLYMPSRAAMNAWGVRREPIQIVQWGDREASLRVLSGRQKFRHIRRMVLELEGKARAAARVE